MLPPSSPYQNVHKSNANKGAIKKAPNMLALNASSKIEAKITVFCRSCEDANYRVVTGLKTWN